MPYRVMIKNDSVQAARDWTRPLTLVFASGGVPGGGWRDPAVHGQEESVVRHFDVGPALELSCYRSFYDANRKAGPLGADRFICLSVYPGALLFAAAPNARRLVVGTGTAAKERLLRTTIQKRAQLIVDLFAGSPYDALILGAWGCGHFRNDPYVVARAFANATRELAKPVVYACPDPKHYDIFRRAVV